jgi:serine/threonine protein kinase
MEKQPSIHPRDDELLDGSTVQRALTPEFSASIGSTASLAPSSRPSPGNTNLGSQEAHEDEAKTVIRRASGDSGGASAIPSAQGATPAAVASVLLGTRLNHFLLEELIGGGGMGAVFRAKDDRLDRVVAIKVIPYVSDDQDLQRRFRNEAQNAARLDHPYIARVFDVGQFEQWHYIVFEYVEGINLRDMVARDGVLSIDDAVYYTRQIAEAIEHANSRGIVHRDIKPSNVLVGIDGNVKVVDMGLARSRQIEMSGDMTASGVTLGTFDYISPEQARDPRDADVRSDIYSLGCTLYYLLTASPPYPGGTMLQKLLSHGNAPPPDPRGLRPEVSDNLTAIVHKMLAKDPAARYPRAIDVVADLRELAIREGLVRAQSRGTLTIAPSDPVPQFVIRHLPWMVASGLILAIAAWLQLSSAVGRNDFVIDPPASAVLLRKAAPGPSPLASASTVPQSPASVQPTTVEPDRTRTAQPTDPVATSSTAADTATLPPQFSSLAMPLEAAKPLPASPSETTASPIPVERIVVGQSSNDPAARVTQSLSDAIRLADELKINLIEISLPVVTTSPIKINRDGLTIRSIVGSSEIRFVAGDALSMQRLAMIEVGNNRVDLQDLHLTWNVRSSSIDGGSLFSVGTNNRLVRLVNSTVTIENLAERDEVYAFEIMNVEGPPESNVVASSAMPTPGAVSDVTSGVTAASPATSTVAAQDEKTIGDKSKTQSLVAIELSNVAARGEMTLINLVDPVQLQFRWQNGLLATSRRMLEASGANVRPALGGNQIQIELDQVTSWTQEGFVRMRLGPSGAYPLMIDRNSRGCVFHHQATASHVEINGLEAGTIDPSQLLQLRGEDNAYDFDLIRDSLLLTLTQWNQQSQSLRLADVIPPQTPTWMLDRSPRWVVQWSTPMTTTPPSKVETSNFLQDGTLIRGFDKSRLPNFPKRIAGEPEI